VKSPGDLMLVPRTQCRPVYTPGLHIADPHMSLARHTNPPSLKHTWMLRSEHVHLSLERPLRHKRRNKVLWE
jgi:hypothetical protein